MWRISYVLYFIYIVKNICIYLLLYIYIWFCSMNFLLVIYTYILYVYSDALKHHLKNRFISKHCGIYIKKFISIFKTLYFIYELFRYYIARLYFIFFVVLYSFNEPNKYIVLILVQFLFLDYAIGQKYDICVNCGIYV